MRTNKSMVQLKIVRYSAVTLLCRRIYVTYHWWTRVRIVCTVVYLIVYHDHALSYPCPRTCGRASVVRCPTWVAIASIRRIAVARRSHTMHWARRHRCLRHQRYSAASVIPAVRHRRTETLCHPFGSCSREPTTLNCVLNYTVTVVQCKCMATMQMYHGKIIRHPIPKATWHSYERIIPIRCQIGTVRRSSRRERATSLAIVNCPWCHHHPSQCHSINTIKHSLCHMATNWVWIISPNIQFRVYRCATIH